MLALLLSIPPPMPNLIETALSAGAFLLEHQQRLVTAESCTAGGVTYYLTANPGSSAYIDGGFVTYSNAAKQAMLGVSEALLNQYGAVSEEVAIAMAEGALKNSEATVSLSITGIAGPAGGSQAKPVGLVCFAFSAKGRSSESFYKQFEGERQFVREQAIVCALHALIKFISSGEHALL